MSEYNDKKEKARQNVDYGYDIQKVYLEMMLADAGTFVRCQIFLIVNYLIENCKNRRNF
jgi:hypothetical protein